MLLLANGMSAKSPVMDALSSDLNTAVSKQTPPKAEDDCFRDEQPQLRAARLIQGHRRALVQTREVQKNTVLPREIYEFLHEKVKELTTEYGMKVAFNDLAWTCAREIQAFINTHDRRDPRSERSDVYSKHFFPAFSEANTYAERIKVNLPLSLWIRRVPDGNGLEVEMISEIMGQGSFKKVFKSIIMLVNMEKTPHQMTLKECALVRTRKAASQIDFMKGVKTLRTHFTKTEMAQKDFRIAGNLSYLRRFGNKIEARDKLLDGDVISVNPSLSHDGLMHVYANVATSLKKLHAKGLVHSDVKLGNILVKREGAEGFLGDLDFLKVIGMQKGGTPGFSDELVLSGVSTPFHDIYGLAICIVHTTFNLINIPEEPREMMGALRRKFKEMTEQDQAKYASLFSALLALIHSNAETVAFSHRYPDLRAQLKKGGSEQKRKAMSILYAQFPDFKSFLDVVEKRPA